MTFPFDRHRRLTLRGRWLLSMTGQPVESGWLRVEGGLVTAIGRRSPPGPPEEQVDLDDAVVLPGLVNAHTHLEFSHLDDPLDAAGGLPDWIARLVALRRERAGAEHVTRGIERGLAESGAAGVTLIGEIATHVPVAPVAAPGPAVRTFREGLGLRPATAQAAAAAVRADLDRLARAGCETGISPHAPYSVSAALGRRLVELAQHRRLPVAMHLCESLAEEELLAGGSGPFRRLLEDLGAWDDDVPPALLSPTEWIGLLARARRGLVVHATHIGRDPAALARLARHRDRLAVVICPRTTRRLSGLLPPVPLLQAAGIRIALGTDSRASNPDLALLPECQALVDAGLVSPERAVRMATVAGACALGLDDRAGILAVGRPADLTILEPTTTATDPWHAVVDPATKIVATLRRGRPIHGRLSRTG